MKKVSIIIPIYNAEKHIKRCLDNLLSQDYGNIEIILIDDGSTDNSLNICNEYSKRNSIIKSYHTLNRGSGPARNYGIEKATGDYVYFMDADDSLSSIAISSLVKVALDKESDLIVFGYQMVNSRGKVVNQKIYREKDITAQSVRGNYEHYIDMNMEWGIQGAPWNKFFNLQKIKKYRILYPDLKRHQDEVFISRYISVADKISFISNIFYDYYFNDTVAKWKKFPIDYIDIVNELKQFRIDIICKWNPSNTKVKELINREHAYNVIKCLELLFNPKFAFSKKEIIKRMNDIMKCIEVNNTFNEIINLDGLYSRKMKTIIQNKRARCAYLMILIKINIRTNFLWILNIKKILLKTFFKRAGWARG